MVAFDVDLRNSIRRIFRKSSEVKRVIRRENSIREKSRRCGSG